MAPKHNRRPMFDATSALSREGDGVDHRDPSVALAEREEAAAALLGEVEHAAEVFGDDVHRDPRVHEATVRLFQYLITPHHRTIVLGQPALLAIGRKCLALAVLLKFCAEGVSDLAEIYGSSRQVFSAALQNLAKQIGLPTTDRSEVARKHYSDRARKVWRERHAKNLGKCGSIGRETAVERQRRSGQKRSAPAEASAPEVNHFNGEAESEVTP